jgi:hypothetical protein
MKSARIMAAALLAAMGCGEPASDLRGASPPSERTLLSISGVVHGPDGSPLPGVEACLHRGFSFGTDSGGPARLILPDAADCTISAVDGSFRVSGAHRPDMVILTFRREGFAPMVRALATRTDDVALPATENALMATPLTFMGEPADPSKGHIPFSVTTPGTTPADLTRVGLEADSLRASAFSLLTAFDDSAEIAPLWSLDDSPTAGTAVVGGFANVPSALYLVSLQGASAACTASTGLHGDLLGAADEAAIIVPVLEGYVTAPVSISCIR